MKFTDLKLKTMRNSGEPSKNADLLIRAGYIDQLSAGVYTYLPLGLRVLGKIGDIIRDEMNKAGGQELSMPVMQPKTNWEKTGRWEAMDDLYRFTSYYSKTDIALGPTHEEVVTPLAQRYISSYKDLPLYLYQIQTKFRDEKRAKSGILRGREFLMKDLYSFHTDEKDLDKYYEVMKQSYRNIYDRLGLGDVTYLTFASGGTFSKYSHEFQTVSEVGEDTIYLCEKCKVALNKEIIEDQKVCPECGTKDLKELKGIEVGNIFKLGTKYSKPFNLEYADEKDKRRLVTMGCYGIGLSRLMGTMVEVFSDDRGIVWPESVSPYDFHLIDLDGKKIEAAALCEKLEKAGYSILWDDRDESAGVKLSDADLLGINKRILISNKTVAAGKVELKIRSQKEAKLVTEKELI